MFSRKLWKQNNYEYRLWKTAVNLNDKSSRLVDSLKSQRFSSFTMHIQPIIENANSHILNLATLKMCTRLKQALGKTLYLIPDVGLNLQQNVNYLIIKFLRNLITMKGLVCIIEWKWTWKKWRICILDAMFLKQYSRLKY